MSNKSKVKESNNNLPNSRWSNIKYGLGMATILVIPPLFTGASVKDLIMGYMVLINSIYIGCAVSAAISTLRPTQPTKRGNHFSQPVER